MPFLKANRDTSVSHATPKYLKHGYDRSLHLTMRMKKIQIFRQALRKRWTALTSVGVKTVILLLAQPLTWPIY